MAAALDGQRHPVRGGHRLFVAWPPSTRARGPEHGCSGACCPPTPCAAFRGAALPPWPRGAAGARGGYGERSGLWPGRAAAADGARSARTGRQPRGGVLGRRLGTAARLAPGGRPARLAGVGLSVTSRVSEAVFGANLVVVAGGARADVGVRELSKGAVLVNATGRDLPDDLVDGLSQVYMDDLPLMADKPAPVLRADARLGGPRAPAPASPGPPATVPTRRGRARSRADR